MKILIVEDNALLGKSLKRGMEELGWTVDLATDGQLGLYSAESSAYDVIVLDWMLPKMSGVEVLKELRAKDNRVPVIMITARGDLQDRVEGLETGADDYLVKPFEALELVTRIKSLYRRSVGKGAEIVAVGDLAVDLSRHTAAIKGKLVELTGKEYDLVAALATKDGQLIRRSALLGALYNLHGEPESNSLDVLIGRVRKKLADSGVEIATIRGKGFVLRVAKSPT